MSRALTRSSLGIFWNGDEVDGLTIHAYARDPGFARPALDVSRWGAHIMARATRLGGDAWTVWLWDLKVSQWPSADAWVACVREPLAGLVRDGAAIAWCSVDGAFVDPPDLFDPAHMSEGVWAAVDKAGHVFGPSGLDEPFEPLSDSQLTSLRSVL